MNKTLIFLVIVSLVLAGTCSAVQEIGERANTELRGLVGELPTSVDDNGFTIDEEISGGGGSGSAPIPG
ncbi:MAG: hypothetical protein HXS43_08585 [Theionarchaea archaeon]|nr:hypothetical protein [Theionarchaea archaeon]